MSSPRLLRILGLLAAAGPPRPGRLCAVSAQAVAVAGAGVMLAGACQRAPLCSSDAVAGQLEELGFTLGEGPGVDAHRDGVPVGEPDLARPRRARWPSFGALALEAGAAALFSFPLRLGAVHLGSLTLYQPRAGPLSDDQHADALVMAGVLVGAVLADQAELPAGVLAVELEALSASRAEVHQASGMVSVQLGLSIADALVRLRAHAYAQGRPLAQVAGEVVGGRLRLDA